MNHKIAINGFGRIGRGVLRSLVESRSADVTVVAINDLAPIGTLAHLLKHDSIHGRLTAEVIVDGQNLVVDGKVIRVTAQRNPEDLPWGDVDVAFECTGHFTDRTEAARHLNNGSKRVLI